MYLVVGILFKLIKTMQWEDILLLNCCHMQYEDEKTFIGIFLLVYFCYKVTSVYVSN